MMFYELTYQTDSWYRESRFFNDRTAAIKAAKGYVENACENNLDWLEVYGGRFGDNGEFSHDELIFEMTRR